MALPNVNRTVSETSYLIKALLYLPYFWFVEGVRTFTRMIWRGVVYLDQITATTMMVRLLFTPLFGDFSAFGRILGFPFRLFRLVFGALLIVSGTAGILGVFGVWFIFPFWLFFNYPSLAIVFFAVAWVFALYDRLGKSHLEIGGPWKDGFYALDFACESARGAIRSRVSRAARSTTACCSGVRANKAIVSSCPSRRAGSRCCSGRCRPGAARSCCRTGRT